MPRPPSITEADLARWQDAVRAAAKERPLPAGWLSSPAIWEQVLYPGEWLGEQLRKTGCSEDEASLICTGAGRLFLSGRDSWEIAAEIAAEYAVEGCVQLPVMPGEPPNQKGILLASLRQDAQSKTLFLDFAEPVQHLALDAESAKDLAVALWRHVQELEARP